MNAPPRAALLPVALLFVLPSVLAATSAYLADGAGDEWSLEDVVGVSLHPPADANATADLTALLAADNATDWFFRLSFAWVLQGANASFALYLFGPDDSSPPSGDPMGHAVTLPAGAPLLYAVYLELGPSFPAGSKVAFFDGLSWKNRTFVEFGIQAARNDTAAFVELAAPRASLTFLQAGSAAAAVLVPSGLGPPGTKGPADTVPDELPAPSGQIPGRVPFFDYTFRPPVVFTALGLSDPFAVEGDLVTIFVELTNLGPKNTAGVSCQVVIDGLVLGSREGLALLGGNGTAVLAFDWQVSAGVHNVTARSFPGGSSRSLFLNVPGAVADLSVAETAVRPPTPVVGESFAVDVRIRNDGNAPSARGQLLLKDGTLVLSSAALPPVPPGGTTLVSMPGRLTRSGVVTLRVEIDGVNSQNSTAQVDVPVQPPQPPLGIPAVVWLAVGVAASGAGAWYLTPLLVRKRPPRGE